MIHVYNGYHKRSINDSFAFQRPNNEGGNDKKKKMRTTINGKNMFGNYLIITKDQIITWKPQTPY